jgi:hypothetical protein
MGLYFSEVEAAARQLATRLIHYRPIGSDPGMPSQLDAEDTMESQSTSQKKKKKKLLPSSSNSEAHTLVKQCMGLWMGDPIGGKLRQSGSERRRRGGGDRKSLLPNRLAAARARSWHRCRHGTTARQRGRFGLGTFWIDDATSGSRRRIAVAALLARTVAVRTYDSRPPALAAPGKHKHGAKWFGSGRPGRPKQ